MLGLCYRVVCSCFASCLMCFTPEVHAALTAYSSLFQSSCSKRAVNFESGLEITIVQFAQAICDQAYIAV